MAISIDWATKIISIPQADLTLVSGTLYSMNTETQFRQIVNAIMAGDDGIVFEDSIRHNTEVTVAGVTYARTIEVLQANGYSVTFTPDSQWSVRLEGSNNNLFDIEAGILNQNQVQVIPTNSAGLQVVSTGSGLSAAQDAKLTDIHNETTDIESGQGLAYWTRVAVAALAGKLAGAAGLSITIRDQADTKNRITATVDADGNRSSVTVDGS